MSAEEHLSKRQFPVSEVSGPLYHGTTEAAASAIESSGAFDYGDRGHAYLTPHLDLAHRYASAAVKRAGEGHTPAVLQVDGLRGVSGSEVGFMDPEKSRAAGAHYQDRGPEILVLDHSAIQGKPRRA